MKPNLRLISFLSAVFLLLLAVFWFWPQPSIPPKSAAGKASERPVAAAAEVNPPASPVFVEEPAAEAVIPPAQEVGLREIKVQPDLAKLDAFDGWIESWQAASPEARAGMTSEGAHLAAARRPEFKALIVSDPRLALERSVPRVTRQDLPEEIVAQLEKPVSAKGDYNVIYGLPVAGVPVPIEDLTLRSFEVDGVAYVARVYGQMNSVTHRKGTPLRGVAVDNEFAVAENAVRRLEIGERIAPGTTVEEICPVSGLTSTVVSAGESVTEDTPTVEIAERVITLCEPAHVAVLEGGYRSYIQAFGTGGAAGAGFFGTNYPIQSKSIGNLTVLYVRAVYADQQAAPQSEALAFALMSGNAKFLSRQSYGKLTQTTTFTPLITLPGTLASYVDNYEIQSRLQKISKDAKQAALAMGYDHRLFDLISIRVKDGLNGTSWGGGGDGSSIWMGNDWVDTLNHEVGHALGLNHAQFWNTRYLTRDGSGYGTGRNDEYGNIFDRMGGGQTDNYNSVAKQRLNWIPVDFVHSPKTKGTYRIFAYDQATLEAGKCYALTVAKDNIRGFNLEYIASRKDQNANSAIVIGTGMGSNTGHLLDVTPGSSPDLDKDKLDGGIAVGQTFSDLEADMHFTVMSKNDTVPPSLDVYYEQGPFSGNVAPVINGGIVTSTVNPNVGGNVDFAVVANDANQDVLTYHWQFSDGVSGLTNTPQVTRTFNTINQITAMVTVSDRKGGTARSSVVINVGAHGKRTVSGFVRSGGVGIRGVFISSGDIGCYSDSDGAYRLAGLPTAALDLLPISYGYQPTPVNVAANLNLMDIALTSRPYVTLSKVTDTGEGQQPGRFRLTRTGSTAAALQVRVSSVGGTATKTSDYTLDPDSLSADNEWKNVNFFTILAGQAFRDIVVSPVEDALAEGPETITLSLFPAPGPVYVSGTENAVTDNASKAGEYYYNSANYVVMNFSDDDTVLPQISVTATDPSAAEAGLDAGSFTFSRTGPTVAALNIDVTWTGTATNGIDYALLPNPVVIPAGQASVNVVLVPVDDNASEGLETAVVTLVARANSYVLPSSGLNSATVTISDNDSVVLSVSAPDATATEGGNDNGFFMISRTGSTAAALKVYYGLSGTAQHGTDYVTLSGEVTIPAGATSAPVIIVPLDDDFAEPPETVVIALNTFNTGVDIGPSQQAFLTLRDNNDLPQVSLQSGAIGVEESANPSFFIRSFGNGAGVVAVNYTLSGTATSGVDYNAMAGTINIPANGFSTTEVTIPLINDILQESTETLVVTLTPSVAYRIYNDREVQLVVRDNDSGGERVMVSTRGDTPSEAGATPGTFYFSRTGTVGALVVTYDISGTAVAGMDFVDLPGGGVAPANRRTVTIPAGSSGVNVVMTPRDDNTAEGPETVTLSVVGGATYSADLPASATYTILDNEVPALTVGFQNLVTLTSELPTANGQFRDITVQLSAPSQTQVTVGYRGAGGAAMGGDVDWGFVDAANGNARLPSGGTLVFPANNIAQSIRIWVKNDGVREGAEIALLELHRPLGASLTQGRPLHSLVINDGAEIPSLVTEERWNTTNVYTNNSWAAVVPDQTNMLLGFTAPRNVADSYSRRMTGQIVAPATGDYIFSTAGDDGCRLYLSNNSLPGGKEEIASSDWWRGFQSSVAKALVAGQSYYMEVQHYDSGGDDNVSVAWQGPGFERTPLVFTTPDATPYTVSLLTSSSTRLETDGSEPLLMAVLNRPAGSTAITVNYAATGTATAGSDYQLGLGSVTFAAGEQVKLLPLTILADAINEAPEAIVVTLSNSVGAALVAPTTHIITVQDAAVPTITTLYATASSGSAIGTVIATAAATPAPGRNITGWAIAAGNIGNAFTINAAGQVTLATPAALPNPGGMQLVLRATDNTGTTGDGVLHIVCNTPANRVTEQRWNGENEFNTDFMFAGTANYTGTLATFTTPTNVGNNYSRRLIAYIKPEVSGDYRFWLSGDDNCGLYLSSNSSQFNKSQIASANWWDGFKNSVVIPLVAGRLYWFEAQHREFGGGDSLAVEWQIAGGNRTPIPAAVIFPYIAGIDYDGPPPSLPTIALTLPVAGAAFNTGDDITLSVNVEGGTLPITAVEFYRGSTLIGSDSIAPYNLTWTGAIAGNYTLTARAVYLGGSVTSSSVGISVVNANPAEDSDGDGFTTGLELALGTNPYNATSQPPSLYANLRAWWKFDETSGPTADDSTGRSQDGAVTGATWTSGAIGNALDFNGVNQGVLIGNSAALSGTGDFTVSAWVKVPQDSTGGVVIRQSDPGGTGNQGIYTMEVNPDGTVNFSVTGSTGNQFNLGSVVSIKDNQWHLLAGVRSGNTGIIYIDGVSVANGSGTLQPLTPRAVAIGYDPRSGNQRFKGLIDDVRIYERALPALGIDELYKTPIFDSGLLVMEASENVAFEGNLRVSNAFIATPLTFIKLSGPAWLSVAPDGKLRGTPALGNVGLNVIRVRVSGNGGYLAEANVAITVNAAPRFTTAEFEMAAAVAGSAYAGTLVGRATDPENNAMSFSKLSGPDWLTVGADGSLTGIPQALNFGANLFVVRVADLNGASSVGLVTIRVGYGNAYPPNNYGSLVGTNTSDEFIQRVRIADLDNTSGNNGGFANFQSFVASMNPGQLVSYTLTPAWSGTVYSEAWTVWIDLNRDGDFGDAGERVLTLTGSRTERTGTFLIPASASLGMSRMRIAMKYNTAASNPTGSYSDGEVEDYSVQIAALQQPNAAPYFLADPVLVSYPRSGGGAAPSLAGRAADWENHPLTFSKISGPAWLQVSPAGELSGIFPSGGATTEEFTVAVTDSLGASDTTTLRTRLDEENFISWIASQGLVGAAAGFDQDPDGDGLANGIEFVLGGQPNPANSGYNSTGLLPKPTMVGGNLVFTFSRKDTSEVSANLIFQWSNDLVFPLSTNDIVVGATDSTANGISVDVTEDSSDTDTIVIVIPATNAINGKLFGRLKAQKSN